MIQVITTYKCCGCGSEHVNKNGTNKAGNSQYPCKDCAAYRVLEPQSTDIVQHQAHVLRAYRERARLRGLERILGIVRQQVIGWIETELECLPSLLDSLLSKRQDDILELDELGRLGLLLVTELSNYGVQGHRL